MTTHRPDKNVAPDAPVIWTINCRLRNPLRLLDPEPLHAISERAVMKSESGSA